MSWPVYTAALPADVKPRVAELQLPDDPYCPRGPRDEQVNAAKAAALALIDSGAVGNGEAFLITLAGHANDNHKPTRYLNDTITVTVTQVPATAVTEFDQQRAAAQKTLE